MSTKRVKRCGFAPCAAVAALLLAAAGARADVTVERTMKIGGIAGFGGGESSVVEKLGGLRKRTVTAMKMTGLLGKMAGEQGGDEITDIARDVVWRIDHKNKTYTESKIAPPPRPKQAPGDQDGRKEQEGKPRVRVVRSEVTVSGPDGKKTIGEFSCDHYAIVWVIETEDLETKERSQNTMTTDLWTTAETAEIRKLSQEEREFTQAWLRKIGWEMSDQEAQKMGLGQIGAMLGGDEETLKKGLKEVAAKLEKIKGFAIGTGTKWQIQGTGGAAAKQGGEGMPDIPKGLGGLMAALGKKGAKGGGAAPGGANTIFDTYTEIRRIGTEALPASEFVPPENYRKVGP